MGEKRCLVIGLDGVLCASATEAANAATAAAYTLWPEEMAAAQDINLNEAGVRQSWVEYDWSRFVSDDKTEQRACDAPVWLFHKVEQLRNVCDSEWELVLLARLCVEEALACRANRAKGRYGARPLTIGEVEANWVDSGGFGVRESLLARWGSSKEELHAALSHARSCVGPCIGRPPEDRFYLDVLEAVHIAVACGAVSESVYVVTSRDLNSAVASLQQAGGAMLHRVAESQDLKEEEELARWRHDHQGSWAGKDGWQVMHSLMSAEQKADAVESLCNQLTAAGGGGIHIVDDSVSFLRACASRLSLGAAQMYLASWGYVSQGRWADSRARLPRVRELGDATEFDKVLWPMDDAV